MGKARENTNKQNDQETAGKYSINNDVYQWLSEVKPYNHQYFLKNI